MRASMVHKQAWVALMGVVLMGLVCTAALAQEPNPSEIALARVALGINTFDQLAARCAQDKGFSAAEQKQIEQWQSANSVAQLRAQVRGNALAPALRKQVDEAAGMVVQKVPAGMSACAAALSVTRTPDAQFAKTAPQLIASLQGNAGMPAAGAQEGRKPAPPQEISAAASGRGSELAAQIEGFGFDTCTGIGYGGMVIVKACPVVLFKNGEALEDVEGLAYPQGLAAHKSAKPKEWTRWRRSGDKVQLEKTKGWENLGYTVVYRALPKDFRLDGLFRSLGGGGNIALGGGQAVAAWSDYRFSPDGRVERGGGAGATSSGAGVSVVTGSTRAGKTGRYRVDGFMLVIQYDDGTSENRILVADPKDEGKGTMWLDGEGYVRRKQ
jgi:hypothetical protein